MSPWSSQVLSLAPVISVSDKHLLLVVSICSQRANYHQKLLGSRSRWTSLMIICFRDTNTHHWLLENTVMKVVNHQGAASSPELPTCNRVSSKLSISSCALCLCSNTELITSSDPKLHSLKATAVIRSVCNDGF